MSAEATVVRNYLDWMTELPWSNKSKINTDLNNAQKILDEDHYGLNKVKERIIEYHLFFKPFIVDFLGSEKQIVDPE